MCQILHKFKSWEIYALLSFFSKNFWRMNLWSQWSLSVFLWYNRFINRYFDSKRLENNIWRTFEMIWFIFIFVFRYRVKFILYFYKRLLNTLKLLVFYFFKKYSIDIISGFNNFYIFVIWIKIKNFFIKFEFPNNEYRIVI